MSPMLISDVTSVHVFSKPFRKFFKGSGCEEEVSHIRSLTRNKNFPNILIVSDDTLRIRYFNIGSEVYDRVKEIFDRGISEIKSPNQLPVTLKDVLLHMKDKMVATKQVHMDLLPEIVDVVIEGTQRQPNFIEYFQVAPSKAGHVRFAVNITKKDSSGKIVKRRSC